MVKWSIIEYCGLTEKSSCGYCKNAGHKASLGTENGVEDPDEGDSVSFGRMFCSYNGFGEFYAVTGIRVERAGDDGAVSIEAKQMRAAGSAVSMLLDKIGIICEYLKGVQEGKYPANDEIIREANKICQRLPLLKPAEFDDGFKAQERDARAAMLLAKMTEICGTLSSLQAKTNLLGTITAWRSIATIPQQQPKKKSAQRVTAATAPAAPVAADVGANNVGTHSPDVD
ncbi:hypothetical protein ANCDUO_01472 [Ancylostoma duodenale]|uniref:EIF3F/CSN6-like C-terminal domain-containing protein n=1 Tax=Ancylostoma duodenale TaxID=51022 RepID=A0A0C2DYU0_9BILA|nr:hypothetical protein ANCDUO_01472 [Ancylostoma duodenale]